MSQNMSYFKIENECKIMRRKILYFNSVTNESNFIFNKLCI